MNALDVLCAQLTRDLFAIAMFLSTIGRLFLHCWYSLGRHVTTSTPMVIFCSFDCLLTVFDEWYTVPIVKNTQNHRCINRHRSTKTVPTVYQRCTNRQKQSKTVNRQSKQHKNVHWCTSRHMSTKTVPTV